MKKNGFTLIELLVVIAILAILIALGSKGLRSARINAKKAQAMIEMKSIETAIKAYMNKYGRLPAADVLQGQAEPKFDEDFSKNIIAILTAEDLVLNQAEIIFLEPQGNTLDGTFLDPWGQQYVIALDTDYNKQVVIEGEVVRRKVALRSIGLYTLGNEANTNALINSWQ